jgi:hypothetical protein
MGTATARGILLLLVCCSAVACGHRAAPGNAGPWTGDDSQFVAARRQIESIGRDFAALDSLIAEARAKCDGGDPTSLDLYRWAYATIKRCRNDYNHYQAVCASKEARKPADLFPRLANPNGFEFERVRFLYSVNFEAADPALTPLGESLLAKAPNDAPIMLALLKLYKPDKDEADTAKGLALIGKLDSLLPYDFSVLRTTSYFFHLAWKRTHAPGDGRESIRRAEEAIELSRSETQRKLLQKRIDEVRAWLGAAKP